MEDNRDVNNTGPAGPGSQLGDARDALKISRSSIASQLHIDESIIDALEKDQYERLPAAMYVRGYIRSYARIVNIDAQPLVASFDCFAEESPSIHPYASRPPEQASSSDALVKAVSYSLLTAILILVVAWWWPRQSIDEPVPVESALIPSEEPQYEELPEWKPPVDTLFDDAPVETTQIDQSAAGGIEPLAETSDGENLSAGEIQEALDPALRQLTIVPAGDSWTKITDAQNNELYLGTARGGTTIAVRGIPPFEVVIGFSPKAIVRFEGDIVDITSFSVNGVARFSLGESGPR